MTIRVANAPCSWGVLEFELDGPSQDFAQVLDEMALAGYSGTELGDWGFLPTDPARLRDELARRQLDLVGAFVPVALSDPQCHRSGAAQAVRTARLLADVADGAVIVLADDSGMVPTRVANAGRVTAELGLPDAAQEVFAGGAQRVARAVREETGLRTVFHHHAAGYVETSAEVDWLMDRTDPALIGLCLDTGHFTFGGGDPVEAVRRLAGRIGHVHFKDCHGPTAERSRSEGWDYFQAVRRGVFCELGQGDVDFAGLLRELRSIGYNGWIVVEQDVLPGMGTPLESATRNRQFLTTLGL
jgi:inosose dehydratase